MPRKPAKAETAAPAQKVKKAPLKKGPNPVKQAAFLKAYVVAGANVTAAAKSSQVDPSTHYEWLASDPTYPPRFEAAEQEACDAIEREIFRRGQQGYEEPIVYQGVISRDDDGNIVTVRKYSDTLLIFRAKALMPAKYGDKTKLEHSGEVSVLRLIEDENFNQNDAHQRARDQAAETSGPPGADP